MDNEFDNEINDMTEQEEIIEAYDNSQENEAAENDEVTNTDSIAQQPSDDATAQPVKGLSARKLKKLAKLEKKKKIREIKHILLGNLVVLSDGRVGAGSGMWVTRNGVADGASSAILLGVKMKKYNYSTTFKSNNQAVYRVKEAMSNIGRCIYLDTAPKASACFVKSVLFKPVVLVFECVNKADGSENLELSAYCGRSLFAFFSLMRIVSRFNKELPEEISRAK